MAFDFHNPKSRSVNLILRGKFGNVLVEGESFVPTPEQEDNGLTAKRLEEFCPKFIKRTPPAVRRRLLEASDLPVPKDVISATAHQPEFGGASGSVEEKAPEEVEVQDETVSTEIEVEGGTEAPQRPDLRLGNDDVPDDVDAADDEVDSEAEAEEQARRVQETVNKEIEKLRVDDDGERVKLSPGKTTTSAAADIEKAISNLPGSRRRRPRR